jgi:uncharacterized protein (DUF433 family)
VKTLSGVIHGKVIELAEEVGLPDGQQVTVTVRAVPQDGAVIVPKEPLPGWLERLDIDPAVHKGKYVVKGTGLMADDVVFEMEQGRTDAEILRSHPKLTPRDVAALREYAKVPWGLRRLAGVWANDAAELDAYLEWNRRQKQVRRRPMWESDG